MSKRKAGAEEAAATPTDGPALQQFERCIAV